MDNLAQMLAKEACSGKLSQLDRCLPTHTELIIIDVRSSFLRLSDLTMLGIRQVSALVCSPQSSVLAIGEARKKFMSNLPDLHDEIMNISGENSPDLSSKIHQVMSMTLSVDERVIQVGLAQKFLNTVRHYLEAPTKLL